MTVTPGAYRGGMDAGDLAQMAHDSVPPEMFADPLRDAQDEQAEREWCRCGHVVCPDCGEDVHPADMRAIL